MLEAILDLGMGDALHARSFLITYCMQKQINHKDVIIYPGRHKDFFENDNFILKENPRPDVKFFRYDNFGQLNILKKYDDCSDSVKTICVNSGIKFDFNIVTPLNWKLPDISELNIPETFITVNYGYDDAINPEKVCSKVWPLDYWIELVKKINIPCIQIGSGKNCKTIQGVSKNFVNKLSIKQSAAIMKKAKFHIDIEGGLAILNYHLGCKSVVLFGPTSIKRFGLNKNLNLWNTKCKTSPCNPKNINLIYHGIYRDKNNLECSLRCMKDLTPTYVIDKIYENKWL